MWPGRVSNTGPLAYESGAQPIALRGLARMFEIIPLASFHSRKLVLWCMAARTSPWCRSCFLVLWDHCVHFGRFKIEFRLSRC